MLLANAQPLPLGAVVEFQFKLDDGLVALAGRAEVVRTLADPPRMGLRFVLLDDAALSLVQRLVEASEAAPEVPTTPGFAPPAVEFDHGIDARAAHGRDRRLLHVQPAACTSASRGCFLPAETDVPLGTGYQLDIFDEQRTAAPALQGQGGREAGALGRPALHRRRAQRAAGAARRDREAGADPRRPRRVASRSACWSSLPRAVSGSAA